MAERDGREGYRRRDSTVETGLDGGTGRYGQVLTTGRDGRGIFCRRDGTVVLTTGRDGWGRFCRRDGTVGARFVHGTGQYMDISSTGRDGNVLRERFSRRDGTVRVNGR